MFKQGLHIIKDQHLMDTVKDDRTDAGTQLYKIIN